MDLELYEPEIDPVGVFAGQAHIRVHMDARKRTVSFWIGSDKKPPDPRPR